MYKVKKIGEQAAATIDSQIRSVLRGGTSAKMEKRSGWLEFKLRLKFKIKNIRKTIAEWIYGDIIYEDW